MYSYIERQNHCGYTKELELLAKFGEFEHIADINLPNAIPMTQIVRYVQVELYILYVSIY